MNQALNQLLARKLQKQQSDNTLYKIRDLNFKNIQYKQDEIQNTFKNYYNQLYTSYIGGTKSNTSS